MLWIEVFFEKAAPGRNNGKTGKERLISSLFLAFLQGNGTESFQRLIALSAERQVMKSL
ncbi:hypothetical protein NYE24_32580 [Paenibacillus sp. FSL H7-0350]|uniref:hypothetical protein n=1 Tax=Paenibacillus sp. FSL H7-0350 TaxID=2975345 RepID=UPI00315923C0